VGGEMKLDEWNLRGPAGKMKEGDRAEMMRRAP
jgi:hypothetical protein